MARSAPAAGALEGVETGSHPAAQLMRSRGFRHGPPVGQLAAGLLARRLFRHTAPRALPNACWQTQGLVGFLAHTVVYGMLGGPACPVVWEAPG